MHVSFFKILYKYSIGVIILAFFCDTSILLWSTVKYIRAFLLNFFNKFYMSFSIYIKVSRENFAVYYLSLKNSLEITQDNKNSKLFYSYLIYLENQSS